MMEWLIIAWLYVTGLLLMYAVKTNVAGCGNWRWYEIIFYPLFVLPAAIVGMGESLSRQLLNDKPLLNYALGIMVMFFVVSQALIWLAMAGIGYLLVWQFILVMLPVLALSWLIYQFEGKEWQ